MLYEIAEGELAKALGYAERAPPKWKQSPADRTKLNTLAKQVKRGTLTATEADHIKCKMLAASKAAYENEHPRRPSKKIWKKAVKDYASIREDIVVERGGLTPEIARRLVENAGPEGVAERKAQRDKRNARKKPKRIKAEKPKKIKIDTELLYVKAIRSDGTRIYPAKGERCACCDWGRYFHSSLSYPEVAKYPASTSLWYDICTQCVKHIEQFINPKESPTIELTHKPGQPFHLPINLDTDEPLALEYEEVKGEDARYSLVGRGAEHHIGMVSKEGASAEEHNWLSNKSTLASLRSFDRDDMGRPFSKAVQDAIKVEIAKLKKLALCPQTAEN